MEIRLGDRKARWKSCSLLQEYLDRPLLPVGESAVTVSQATLQRLEDFHKKRVTELVG